MSLDFLLQAEETAGAMLENAAEGAAPVVKEITLWNLAVAGGWFMIPLFLLLLWGIYLFFERYFTIRKSNQDPERLLQSVTESVRRGELTHAQSLCEQDGTPFGRMLAKGIRRLGSPLPDIAASIENEAKLEVNRLEKSLAYLATIAGAAPMIGFLGTVTGMIQAFITIAQYEGTVNPSLLSGGIYEAMITTAMGLIVGIPAYLGYNMLSNMIGEVIAKMEVTSTGFIDVLQEPAKG